MGTSHLIMNVWVRNITLAGALVLGFGPRIALPQTPVRPRSAAADARVFPLPEDMLQALDAPDDAGVFTFAAQPVLAPQTTMDQPTEPWVAELAALKEQVNALEAAAADEKKAASKKPSIGFSAELQADAYAFNQDDANKAAVGVIPDGVAFRRARVAAVGTYGVSEYKMQMDFAEPGRPTFLDVFAAVNAVPVLGQVKAGNFFEPFGLERLTSNVYATFMERALPDQPFDPSRNPGVQAMNQYGDLRGTWAIGGFVTHTDNFADFVSNSGGHAVTGRLTFLPYYDEPSDGRYYVHLGTAFSHRATVNHQVQFAAQPEARLGAATPNVPDFINTGTFAANSYQEFEGEFAASLNSLHLQAEGFLIPVERISGPNPFFYGWYAQAAYFLTGEYKPYQRETATFTRIQPNTQFFFVRRRGGGTARGWGAWQIATRVSQVNLTSAGIEGGKLTDLTFGLNWFLNPYMRITTNLVHPFLNSPTSGHSQANIFGSRVQYDF